MSVVAGVTVVSAVTVVGVVTVVADVLFHLCCCCPLNTVMAVVDCKTVGFFLKISKEIGKAWRTSLTRAKRASLTHP